MTIDAMALHGRGNRGNRGETGAVVFYDLAESSHRLVRIRVKVHECPNTAGIPAGVSRTQARSLWTWNDRMRLL